MKIYDKQHRLILDVIVDDNSYRNRVIMGDHSVTLYYSLPEHVEIPVGAFCYYEGETYTLMRPEQLKMKHSRLYEYTVQFSSEQEKAKIWKFRNPVDGRLKFPLTAKPKEHLQMIVDNMNRRDSGWTVGDCIDDVEKLISYDHDYCWDALCKQATEFNTEFEFSGKKISLKKVEYDKSNPLPLAYGKGNGFKPNIGRSNTNDSLPIEILFVQGGDTNIDRSKYPTDELLRSSSNGCLLLPIGQTLAYDGEHFEGENGFNPAQARHYQADDLGLSIRNIDKEMSSQAEDSLDRSDDYPKRVGKISKVVEVDKAKNFYDIIDSSIPANLNYEDYLIGEEEMSIIFQSGMLAGKEFDVKYYHEAKTAAGTTKDGKRFEIVPQEIDGIMMPGDSFVPKAGDTYAVFHVMLPEAYIRDDATKSGASWDMFRAAVKHLFDNEEKKLSFTGELDGIWAKRNWVNIGGKIRLGGFIKFTHQQIAPEGVLVRITNIKDYINKPHSPKIELSNETIGATVSSTLKQLESSEVVVEENHKTALQFTKRRFRDAKETIEMVEAALLDNFTNSINPIAVETMSLLVGDERLQYQFVEAPGKTTAIAHNIEYNQSSKQLIAPAGTIQHLTLGIDCIRPSHEPNEYHYWVVQAFTSAVLTDASKKYYLYIRAQKKYNGTAGSAEFRLETSAHKLEEGDYYWLLTGVLNSEYDGERSFATLYGFTEILPGRITADRLLSSDGQSYFDMLNAALKLKDKLQYNVNGDGELKLKGIIVQSQNGIDEAPLGCYRGDYNNKTTYFNGDEATYRPTETSPKSLHRCISPTPITGIPPTDTSKWQVVAQGVTGEEGKPGISPNASFKSTVFKRTNSTPTAPTGGSFSSPVPTGWSDGIPSGEEMLWASTRIFTTDGKDPQQSKWTTPRQMTDTANFDVEFSSEIAPSMPTGHPNTNTEWSNKSDENTIWMATSTKHNGVWSDWQVSRIKGEDGEDGTSIKVKGVATAHYATDTAFLNAERTPSETEYSPSFASCKRLIDSTSDGKHCVVAHFKIVRSGSSAQGYKYGYSPVYSESETGDGWVMNDDGHLYLASGNEGWKDIGQFKGEDGTPGKPAYVHFKFANSLTENDWTANNGETPGNYIGIYADNNPKDQLVWSLYKWSRWTGQDGLGYEFIYKRTSSSTAPDTPTQTSQNDEFVPDGWTDDPTGVSASYPYEWVCYRKKTEGLWGNFIGSATDNAKAALWAKYGETGAAGNYTEYRFAVNGSTTEPPDLTKTAVNPSGWSTSMPKVNKGQYLWLTKAVKTSKGTLVENWSTPVRMTPQDGQEGKPGLTPAAPFRGIYDNTKTYYGTEYRIDCVKYGNAYYVARTDAGEFSGIVPTDTSKWNPFGASYESVATDLLLAEFANIANLIFRNQRLESFADTNGIPNFFIDGLNNIASFSAGNVVFDKDSARIGWLRVLQKDLVGYDNDGIERLRLTPDKLPSANTKATKLARVVDSGGGTGVSTSIGQEESFYAEKSVMQTMREGESFDEGSFSCWVDIDIPSASTTLYLTDLQYYCIATLMGSNKSISPTCSLYASVKFKDGDTIASIDFNKTPAPQVVIPKAGRVRITFSMSCTYSMDWQGKACISAQGFPITDEANMTIIARDGIMAIYNGNYLRMHSSEGFMVKIGSYYFRINSSGISKSTNGSTWTAM